jgi:Uncharacterized conserved protein
MEALIPKELESELKILQHRLLENKIPVLILFEGSSGRVIGRVINELVRCLEPREIYYHRFDPEEVSDAKDLLGFLTKTPGKGKIALYDRSWYSVIIDRCEKNYKEKDLNERLGLSNDFERYLTDNGVLVIKILLKATASAIKEYGSQYGPEKSTKSFLSMDHIDPTKYREVMLDHVYSKTNTENCPWDVVLAEQVERTVINAAERIKCRISEYLEHPCEPGPVAERKTYPNPRISITLDKECKHYQKKLEDVSKELESLQIKLSESKRSLIVCFEGWDAAGKGSAIKHLSHAFNHRGYQVSQIKAPSQEELDHTYLWRFCDFIPEIGHITLFDRTWYGRMLVEPIEGFCTEDEYTRSANEILTFEHVLTNNGAIIIKFWMDISPDEQLRRFEKRANDPLKQWKITDDDWRNRSKWKEYDEYVDRIMVYTNSIHSPWTVVESNNKKYARLKVLETVAIRLKDELS